MSRTGDADIKGSNNLLWSVFLTPHWVKARAGDWETIVINISGKEFRTRMRNLRRYPSSRLGKIALASSRQQITNLCDGFIPGQPPIVFYFRNPQNFQVILDIYRRREIHVCESICPLTTEEEFEFWGLSEIFLQPCCALKYFPKTFKWFYIIKVKLLQGMAPTTSF